MKKLLCALATLCTLSTTALADPTYGQVRTSGIVYPDRFDAYDFVLNRDEVTLITVAGSGLGDIDCFIYDEFGNEVDRDADETDTCSLRVLPRWTGRFTVRVENNGRRASYYVLDAR